MTRAMKDSGIEWIGEIPEDWNVARIKSGIAKRDGGAWGDEASNCEGDCICLRIADFDYNKFRFTDSTDLTIRHYTLDIIEKLQLRNGDILIEKSGGGEKTPVGRTVLFDKDYIAIYANFMDRLRCSDIVKPEYMQYVFVTFYKNEYTRNYIKQTTGIQNLDLTSMLSKELMPLPSLSEQEKIADFLDEKCSHIDSVLEKTRASIDEYKQLKQSVITKAVTKGIRPNRPMKDSGIEWIGEIPEDWKIKSFRHMFTERNEKNIPIKTEERLSLSIDKGVTLYAEKTTNLDRFKDDFSQYKLAHEGDFVLNSMNMIVGAVGVSKYFGCVSPAYYTYYNKEIDTAYFYEYLFKTRVMNRVLYSLGKGIYAIERGDDRVNTCRLKVSKDDLKAMKLPCPTQEEQHEIVSYLNDKCSRIDKLITKKEQLIEELETYKKSLIYEYVTGKKEVC